MSTDYNAAARVARGAALLDDFALCSVLAFDDGTLSVQLLQRGALESCKAAAELIDALSYNGPKRVVESCLRWMPWDLYCEKIAEARATAVME
jgi:hypothetical protein